MLVDEVLILEPSSVRESCFTATAISSCVISGLGAVAWNHLVDEAASIPKVFLLEPTFLHLSCAKQPEVLRAFRCLGEQLKCDAPYVFFVYLQVPPTLRINSSVEAFIWSWRIPRFKGQRINSFPFLLLDLFPCSLIDGVQELILFVIAHSWECSSSLFDPCDFSFFVFNFLLLLLRGKLLFLRHAFLKI